MPTSDVQIASSALVLMGESPITSFEGTSRGLIAKQFYDETRDVVLRAHPWKFARTRKVLAALEDAPEFGWNYQFLLPTDPYCLRVLGMSDNSIPFQVEGRNILCDESSVSLIYIARVKDPTQFDSLFTTAFEALLAHKFSIAIPGKVSLGDMMFRLYQRCLQDARSVNAQEGTPEEIVADAFIEVR